MTDDLLSRRPRTRLSFSEADMARLRDLYYDRDVPMTHIAKTLGVSSSTLYHWIAEMDWPRRSATFPIRTQPHRAAVESTPSPGRLRRPPSPTRGEGGDGALRSAKARGRCRNRGATGACRDRRCLGADESR